MKRRPTLGLYLPARFTPTSLISPNTIQHTPEHTYFQCKESRIHALRSGTGEELLVCFHGYGERAGMFAPMLRHNTARYTCYAVDLPLHGESGWKGGALDSNFFLWLLQQIMKKEGKEHCSLMGFSFGGRVGLCLLEHAPEWVRCIYLIAPDGIASSGLYRMIQRMPHKAKSSIAKLFLRPRLPRLARRLYERGWISHHNYRFAEIHFSTPQKRRRLLLYWQAMGHLQPHWDIIQHHLKKHHIPIRIFLGTQDEVVPSKAGQLLTEGIENAEVVFLPANHKKLARMFFQYWEKS